MGSCHSSSVGRGREGSGRNVVYVVEDKGEARCAGGARRMLASLYSKQGRKGPNQDSAILCQGYGNEEGVFCGVFDGHGRNGHEVSKLVRDYLPSLLLSQWNNLLVNDGVNSSIDSDEDGCYYPSSSASLEMFDEWKDACVYAFKAMDKELMHTPSLDCSCSGTTAVSIIKQGKDLIIANLGDSRAVLGTMSDDGELVSVQLTTDLKPNLPREAERIKKRNGRIFALRHEPNIQRVWLPNDNYPGLAMARAFGDLELKNHGVIATPHVSYHHLRDNDQFVVLATDGVWDVLSNQQVVSIIGSLKRKEEAAEAVVMAAAQVWRRKLPSSRVDDCTALCLFLQDVEGECDVCNKR